MLLHDQVELAHNLISIHAHVLGSNNIFSSIDVESGVLFLVLMFLFFNISRVCSALWQNGATFLFHFGQYAESVPPKWKQSLENIGIGEPLVIYIQASKDFGMFDPLLIYKTIVANAAATVTKLLVSEDVVATARASSSSSISSSISRDKKSNDDATEDEDDDTDDDEDDDTDDDEDDKGTSDSEGDPPPLKRQAVGGRNNNQFKSMNKTRLNQAYYALAKAQYNLNVFLEGKGESSIPRTALRQEARNQTRLAFASTIIPMIKSALHKGITLPVEFIRAPTHIFSCAKIVLLLITTTLRTGRVCKL